jgi:hypothetical protein
MDYTVPELDFVLEMAAIDEPEKWQFTRSGEDNQPRSETLAGWGDRLAGRAFLWFLGRTGIGAANQGLTSWRARRSEGGLRPGLSRGGKSIDGFAKVIEDVGHKD